MVNLATFTRSSAWSVLAQAVQVLGGLALSVVVVRALSAEDFGELSVLRQIASLVVIASSLALERSLLRFVPELLHRGDTRSARHFFLVGLGVRVIAWAPFLAVSVILRPWLASTLRIPLGVELPVAVGTAAIFSIHNHVRAGATARFATSLVAAGSLIGTIVTLFLTLWALDAGKGITGVLAAAGIGIAVATLVQWPAAWGRASEAGAKPHPQGLNRRRVLAYVMPFAAISILNHLVHSQTEVYFLAHFHGSEAAGYFQLGFLFAQRVVDFLPLAIWEVSMAGFSHLASSQPERLPQSLSDYLVLLYLAMAPVTMLGVAFSGFFIEWLYGAAMSPAIRVSQMYFLIAGVAAFNAPVGMIIYAREKTRSAFYAYCWFAAVNLGLDLWWIPRFGLDGAIAGLAAGKLLNVLVFAWIAWREVPGLNVPWRFLVRAWLASTPPLLWLWLRPADPALPAALAGVALSVLAMFLAFRLLRVVGDREAELVRRARLPLGEWFLAILGRRT